jgi:asparagine synthase (glutamine-hydrolysing)
MCGIYGEWDVSGAALDLESVQRATTIIRHRGPDDEGYLLADTRQARTVHCAGPDTIPLVQLPRIEDLRAERFDLALGFRRLSILDLSERGRQPMASRDQRFWLVFNGEIYNYRELRAELRGYGHAFVSGSDTEVILAAYEQWGPACLDRFNGMWAFAIWDTRDRALFLARDRFGVKPLHYIWNGKRFSFASEIKALATTHAEALRPDRRAVTEYLAWGDMPSPTGGHTFFEGIRALPPAHWITIRGGRLDLHRYYSLAVSEPKGTPKAEDAVTGYRELFNDAVRIRLRSDVPVGTCLSGGLDSSSIVCVINRIMAEDGIAAEQVGSRQKTFSAVYQRPGRYNETEHIETVLRATGAERNFTVPSAESLAADLRRLVWHQDEPFGSTSIYAQWCVMAKVRERGVTVLLDGQGADEALGGYRPFDIHLADLVRRGRFLAAMAASRDMHRNTGLPQIPAWSRAILRQAPVRYLDRLRHVRQRKLAAFGQSGGNGASKEAKAYRGLGKHLRELITETSLPHLLRYEDRNAMAFSVEGRVPFVDYRVIEYSLGEALPWAVRHGWTKWVLREAVRDTVPPAIVWRRDKVGFETPESDWMEALLSPDNDLSNDYAKSREYVEIEQIRRELERWRREKGDTGPLWRLLNLELWLQAFSTPAAIAND